MYGHILLKYYFRVEIVCLLVNGITMSPCTRAGISASFEMINKVSLCFMCNVDLYIFSMQLQTSGGRSNTSKDIRRSENAFLKCSHVLTCIISRSDVNIFGLTSNASSIDSSCFTCLKY